MLDIIIGKLPPSKRKLFDEAMDSGEVDKAIDVMLSRDMIEARPVAPEWER